MLQKGFITKSVRNLYTVKTAQGLIPCTARGVFRNQAKTPLVGDHVMIDLAPADTNGTICELLPRTNALVRPPIANIDLLLLVVSAEKPAPNFFIMDKLFAIARYHDIAAGLIISKTDLSCFAHMEAVYQSAGYPVFPVYAVEHNRQGIDALTEVMQGKLNVLIGNSGVGKSTVINAIAPDFAVKTGEISEKLGRGRHTTRHVELYPLACGGYLADTPGFSTVDVTKYGVQDKAQLQFCFQEFLPFLDKCRFTGCSHTTEKGCAVLEQVQAGNISQSRHNSYVIMFRELKQIKPWEANG